MAFVMAVVFLALTAAPAWAPAGCGSCGLFIPTALQAAIYTSYPEVEAVAVEADGGVLVNLKDLRGNLRNKIIKDCDGCTLTRSPNNSRVLTGR